MRFTARPLATATKKQASRRSNAYKGSAAHAGHRHCHAQGVEGWAATARPPPAIRRGPTVPRGRRGAWKRHWSPFEGRITRENWTGGMREMFVGSGLFEVKPMSFNAQPGDVYLDELCAAAHSSSNVQLYEMCSGA